MPPLAVATTRRSAKLRWAVCATVAVALAACGTSTPSPQNSAWVGLANALRPDSTDPTAQVPLDPKHWYLKE